MSVDYGGINYRENLLHKHADEFLSSCSEREINEYFKVASTIISECERAKASGEAPPLDPLTIKLVRDNRAAVSRMRDTFISHRYLHDLTTKPTADFASDLTIKELKKYIDVATQTIYDYQKQKAAGTLSHSAPDERTIEAISAKKRELVQLLAQSPLHTAYALEEEATSMLREYDDNTEPGKWYVGSSPHEALKTHQQIFKTYEKAALEFEKLGDLQNAWRVRGLAVKAVRFSSEHPMYEMHHAIKTQKEKNLDSHTGAKVSHLDTSTMKDGSASFDKRFLEERPIKTEGQTGEMLVPPAPTICSSFDINIPARKALQQKIEAIDAHTETFLEEIPMGFCEGVTIKTVPHFYRQLESTGVYSSSKGYNGGPEDTATEIEFQGVGKIIVGNNPRWGCHYNHVTIECRDVGGEDRGKNLKKMEQMLTLLGLPLTLTQRTTQDMERSKITSLFHVYYPTESAKLEQTEGYYTMPLTDLKARILEKIPTAERDTFLERLTKMQPREGLPGQLSWTVPDLVDDLTKNGVWYLMVGMGGVLDDDDAFDRGMKGGVQFLLSKGFLPTTEKYRAGYSSSAGASPGADLQHGGGNGLFTRAINEKLTRDTPSTSLYAFNGLISQFPFSGGVQAILDPKHLIDTNTLFYKEDSYGVDNPESLRYKNYERRKDPAQFAKDLSSDNSDNEVVLRGTIPPQAVRGLVVKTQQRKAELIAYIKKEGLAIEINGKYMINGKELDKFVHVGERFTKEMGA